MLRTLVSLAVFAFVSAPIHAQEPGDDEPVEVFEGHVVGLLSVPTLMPPNVCAPVTVGSSVPLYRRRGDATAIGELRVMRGPLGADFAATSCSGGPDVRVILADTSFPVATDEHGYEESSLVVTSVDRGWYQIRTGGAPGLLWLRRPSNSIYRPLTMLLGRGMTYLADTWDRRLYTRPGGPSTVVPSSAPPHLLSNQSVTLHEVVRVGGAYWARVTFTESCGEPDPPPHPSGWVKVHAPTPSRVPVVWFYSRGC